MTINQAIDELKQILKRTSEEYITKRLENIIDDLLDFMNSPSVGEEYIINNFITELIVNKGTQLENVTHSWVNTLYYAVLNMFRFEQCKNYFNDKKNKKAVKKEIDGETWSKVITIITAILTLIVSGIAIGLYVYGIGTNAEGGFHYDMWAFILAVLGALVIIIGWIVGAVYNFMHSKKYANATYSIEELLAVKHENNQEELRFQSPFKNKTLSLPFMEIKTGAVKVEGDVSGIANSGINFGSVGLTADDLKKLFDKNADQ